MLGYMRNTALVFSRKVHETICAEARRPVVIIDCLTVNIAHNYIGIGKTPLGSFMRISLLILPIPLCYHNSLTSIK